MLIIPDIEASTNKKKEYYFNIMLYDVFGFSCVDV